MPTRRISAARNVMGDVLVLVGTTKGAFVFTSDAGRTRWRVDGPHFPGEAVYSLAFDQRAGRTRLLAGVHSNHWGATIRTSDDFGRTWSEPERQAVRFPESSGLSLAQVWQIEPGRPEEPDVVWCGVEPAALFRSDDAGVSWAPVEGLLNHEHRPKWMPGGGGLCLHTIVLDPTNARRMFIAISAAGAFRTDDGGTSWRPINNGLRSEQIPDPTAEVGHCVHRIAMHPSQPNVLFMQKHWDIMRTDDAGDSWREVSGNLPTDFGFVIDVHAHEPQTIYVVPIKSDSEHYPMDGQLRVFRSRSGGNDWEPLTKGLPQKDCYVNVLRDAMAVDRLDSCGIYFGTTGGQVYGSSDAGDTWAPIVRDLPAVLSVEVQTLPPSLAEV